VDNDTGRRAFVLALSHREKARAMMAEAEQAQAAGRLDAARYTALRDFYAKHLQDAESHLARLQEQERRRLDSLEHQLRATINEQARLVDRAMAGEVAPAKANELNRGFQHEIAALEGRIEASRQVLSATHAADLGPFVDRPLDDYAAPASQIAPLLDRWQSRRWAIVASALFVLGLLLFLVLRRGPTGADLEAAFSHLDPATISVTVTNSSSRPAALYVPWPETGPLEAPGMPAFGLRLHVIENGHDTFKLLPATDACWKSHGYLITNPIYLNPNIPAQVTLDLECIQHLVTRPTAVELTLTTARTGTLAQETFEITLP
jgi:hypothetical protein